MAKTFGLMFTKLFVYRLPQGSQEIQQRKILYMGLYLLIWGEAANVRFMPECLCYIFHNVSTLQISKCCPSSAYVQQTFLCCCSLTVSFHQEIYRF